MIIDLNCWENCWKKLRKVDESWWKLIKIDKIRWKLMKIDENWWRMKLDEIGWKLMETDGNWWENRWKEKWWNSTKIDEKWLKNYKITVNLWMDGYVLCDQDMRMLSNFIRSKRPHGIAICCLDRTAVNVSVSRARDFKASDRVVIP